MAKMRILYYVDVNDNTKTSFMVVSERIDLRNLNTIEKIGKELEEHGFGKKGVCNSIAYELAYHGSAEWECQMGKYEFAIEEAPLLSAR